MFEKYSKSIWKLFEQGFKKYSTVFKEYWKSIKFWKVLKKFQRVFEEYLKSIWKVLTNNLQRIWKVFKEYLKSIQKKHLIKINKIKSDSCRYNIETQNKWKCNRGPHAIQLLMLEGHLSSRRSIRICRRDWVQSLIIPSEI